MDCEGSDVVGVALGAALLPSAKELLSIGLAVHDNTNCGGVVYDSIGCVSKEHIVTSVEGTISIAMLERELGHWLLVLEGWWVQWASNLPNPWFHRQRLITRSGSFHLEHSEALVVLWTLIATLIWVHLFATLVNLLRIQFLIEEWIEVVIGILPLAFWIISRNWGIRWRLSGSSWGRAARLP